MDFVLAPYSMSNEFQAGFLQFLLHSSLAEEVDLSLQLQYLSEVDCSHRRSAEHILLSDTFKASIVEPLVELSP